MAWTIAHISDPHLSRKYYREHIKSFKMLLRTALEDGADHIVVTGDLVSTADEDDYFLAREIFSTLGILRSDRLTVVPGNHDIFGGPHRAVDVLSFPDHIRAVDYQRGLHLFQSAFAETFDGVRLLNPRSLFPFVKQTGPFELIGFNSIPPWSFRHNPLGTNGQLDEGQFEALAKYAATSGGPDATRIALLHHHFSDLSTDDAALSGFWRSVEFRTMRMRKRRRLLRLLSNAGVRSVLHGHIHRNEIYVRDGISFGNGAGSVCDDPIRYLKYNIVTSNGSEPQLRTRILPILYQTSTLDVSVHRFRKPLELPSRHPTAVGMTDSRSEANAITEQDRDVSDLLPDVVRRLSRSVAPPIAAFDLDNTLLDGDIGEALFAQLVSRGIIREFGWKAYTDLLPVKRSSAYRRVVTAMEGLAVEDVRQVVRGLIESQRRSIECQGNSIPIPRANGFMRSLVHDLLGRGWEVRVISASCQAAAEVAAEHLLGIPADHVHGINTTIVEGRYTGELIEPVPIGSGKTDVYEQLLNLPAPALTAGDSILDLPLMNLTSPDGIALWCGDEDFEIIRRNLSPRTVLSLPARLRSKLEYQPSDRRGTAND